MLKNYRELNLIKNGRVLLIRMIDRRCEMNTMNTIVRELLGKNNFKFKRHSWYRLYSDITQIINFQRSQWSDFYYCNVGIDMRHETDIFLPEYKFPIRMRAGQILGHADFNIYLDFEKVIDYEVRIAKIQFYMEICIQFLDSIDSLSKLKEIYRKGLLGSANATSELYHFLNQQ